MEINREGSGEMDREGSPASEESDQHTLARFWVSQDPLGLQLLGY